MKRRFKSMPYYIRKFYRAVSTAKPPALILAIVAIVAAIFLLGGGVYDILEKPLLVFPWYGRWIFFYPYSIHEQILIESLGVMAAYSIGIAGLLLIYQSTKYAYKPRQAFILLLIGAVFLIVAYIFIESRITSKLTVQRPGS